MARVLVVGAGPIGLETAILLEREGHEVTVVDEGAVGATIADWFPPETRFFSSPERLEIAGFSLPLANQEKVTGEQYRSYLVAAARTAGLSVLTYTRCVNLLRQGESWAVQLMDARDGRSLPDRLCDVVVLAVGGTHHPRKLGVPGEELPMVERILADPLAYWGRRVLVVGGRNSAAESAMRIYRAGGLASLSYRGPTLAKNVKYWIRPEVLTLIEEGRIEGFFSTEVVEIQPDQVVLRETGTGTESAVPVDSVLLQLGFVQDGALFRTLGIEMAGPEEAPQYDLETMATSVPGIYVAGTATAGTQDRFGTFIESSHIHAKRIAAALAGRRPPPDEPPRIRAEV